MLEAFSNFSSLITQNTIDVQLFRWLRCNPHNE